MERSFLETRRSIALVIIFSIITFGIYGIWWFCKFQNDVTAKSGEGYTALPTILLFLFTFGVYPIIWYYKIGTRLYKAGITEEDNHILYFILGIFGLSFVNTILWMLAINEHADKLDGK